MNRCMAVDARFWNGKRVFLTGHTGFKGGWLAMWLSELGAQVTGFALDPPTEPSFYAVCNVAERMAVDGRGDIRDADALAEALAAARPEIVLHLAAQPLVRFSYREPVATYAINVMGTVHLLEAVRSVGSVRVVVNITTDKCYENREWVWPYREDEAMGGHDPYSSSKGCAELVTAAYRRVFLAEAGVQLGSARAGNVIGGGDWSDDRLMPDVLRAIARGETLLIRSPGATRPWQHVLEPLSGYLMLAEALYVEGGSFAEGWNFGPNEQDARSVQWILETLNEFLPDMSWQLDDRAQPHEATMLALDIAKARHRLGWAPRWDLRMALAQTLEWDRAWRGGENMAEISRQQIAAYSGTAIHG